jgi:hypothetical protein
VKVEGRKSHAEMRPDVVAEAKRLHRVSPKMREWHKWTKSGLDGVGF